MNTMLTTQRITLPGETPVITLEPARLNFRHSSSRAGCRLEVRGSVRENFTEFHLTATVDNGEPVAPGRCAADDLLGQVAAELAKRKIQPIQEKFYGRQEVREDVLRHRADAYERHGLDAGVPVTWIEGLPLEGGDFIGLQVWGVVSHDGEPCVETVENPVTGRGRVWTGRGFRMLHLPSVRGTLPDGTLPDICLTEHGGSSEKALAAHCDACALSHAPGLVPPAQLALPAVAATRLAIAIDPDGQFSPAPRHEPTSRGPPAA